MSTEENELNRADQTASLEANSAGAADMEIAKSEEDTSEIDELIDYDEDDELEAAIKATQAETKELEREALKEMLTANGHTFPHSRKRMQCLLKTSLLKFRGKTYMK